MPITLNNRKEDFSKAYIRAVAATAGFVVNQPLDYASEDLEIGAPGAGHTVRSPKVSLQCKCTAGVRPASGDIHYELKIKNYNDLRELNLLVQRILVVIFVPDDVTQWLQHSQHELNLRHCGYWCSLHNSPEVKNSDTKTITIPRGQEFTVAALTAIMDRLGKGELP